MKYKIIDALWIFVNKENSPYNRSKAPLSYYEQTSKLSSDKDKIIKNFEIFTKKIKDIGYNSISIDDLPHMVNLEIYEEKTKNIISKFSEIYKEITNIAQKHNIKMFINFDIMFFNKEILKHTKSKNKENITILQEALSKLFKNYEVSGIIVRMGEADGVDTDWIFKSKIVTKNIKSTKAYINWILKICEKFDKTMIVRTWSIWWSKVWDIMWNQKTYNKVFWSIESKNIVISMKYWVWDFFRNMKVNKLFFTWNHKKIVELQAKREYDFFWELPYYTWFEYKNYYEKLKTQLSWFSIRIQTWWRHKSDKITFLKNSSKIIELNAISSVKIFEWKNHEKEIEKHFWNKYILEFLKKFKQISWKILYPKNNTEYFFNKIYVPSILWVFWHNISVDKFTKSLVQKLYKLDLVEDKEFEELKILWKKSNLEKIDFYIDTLILLQNTRIQLHDKSSFEDFQSQVAKYKSNYNFFNFYIKNEKKSKLIDFLLKIFLRNNSKYRLVDKILLNKAFLKLIHTIYKNWRWKSDLWFANKQWTKIEDII